MQEEGGGSDGLPSEAIFRRVFECFGEVRCVDVPVCDPFRASMTRPAGFSFGQVRSHGEAGSLQ
jgi:arginine/serine-rich splicing factor 17